jgi:hypothetical protein
MTNLIVGFPVRRRTYVFMDVALWECCTCTLLNIYISVYLLVFRGGWDPRVATSLGWNSLLSGLLIAVPYEPMFIVHFSKDIRLHLQDHITARLLSKYILN